MKLEQKSGQDLQILGQDSKILGLNPKVWGRWLKLQVGAGRWGEEINKRE